MLTLIHHNCNAYNNNHNDVYNTLLCFALCCCCCCCFFPHFYYICSTLYVIIMWSLSLFVLNNWIEYVCLHLILMFKFGCALVHSLALYHIYTHCMRTNAIYSGGVLNLEYTLLCTFFFLFFSNSPSLLLIRKQLLLLQNTFLWKLLEWIMVLRDPHFHIEKYSKKL